MKKLLIAVLALGMLSGVNAYAGEAADAVATVVPELQDVLQGTLVNIINGVVSAKDFLLEQLPDVLQQLLMWKMVESLAMTVLGLLMLVVTSVYWTLICKYWKNIERNDMEPIVLILGIFGSLCTVGLGLCLPNITWLQIWVAPKVYLIEYAAQLIK